MELKEAIELIDFRTSSGAGAQRQAWADLGCGKGLFSFALAEILPAGSLVTAIDKLPGLPERTITGNGVVIEGRRMDFIKDPLGLADLDGILMANSLHYVANKKDLLYRLFASLKKNARFLIVEYDSSIPNQWVPFPLPFAGLHELFGGTPYSPVRKLAERNSLYGRARIYSAIAGG